MSIHVLFFGKLADTAQNTLGATAIDIDINQQQTSDAFDTINTIDKLTNHLASLSPTLGADLNHAGILYAVNQTLCNSDTAIHSGDEIAFMSPLSGG